MEMNFPVFNNKCIHITLQFLPCTCLYFIWKSIHFHRMQKFSQVTWDQFVGKKKSTQTFLQSGATQTYYLEITSMKPDDPTIICGLEPEKANLAHSLRETFSPVNFSDASQWMPGRSWIWKWVDSSFLKLCNVQKDAVSWCHTPEMKHESLPPPSSLAFIRHQVGENRLNSGRKCGKNKWCNSWKYEIRKYEQNCCRYQNTFEHESE